MCCAWRPKSFSKTLFMVRYACTPATYASDRSVPRKISRSNPDSTPAISSRCFAINSFMALRSSQDVVFLPNLHILSRIEAPSTFGCGSAALCPLCCAFRNSTQSAQRPQRRRKQIVPGLPKMIPSAEEIAITCLLMDSLERKILAAFDRPGARELSVADFGEPAGVTSAVAQLVERGWLRATENPATYARTEDGRLQLAGPPHVTIYSRPGCHLCD